MKATALQCLMSLRPLTMGQTLRLLRTMSQLSQQRLAQQLEVTSNYLSLVEHDRREPSLAFLRRVGHVLRLPVGLAFLMALDDHHDLSVLLTEDRMHALLHEWDEAHASHDRPRSPRVAQERVPTPKDTL